VREKLNIEDYKLDRWRPCSRKVDYIVAATVSYYGYARSTRSQGIIRNISIERQDYVDYVREAYKS